MLHKLGKEKNWDEKSRPVNRRALKEEKKANIACATVGLKKGKR